MPFLPSSSLSLCTGGHAFGDMWNELGQPIKKHTKFPLNTVSFKCTLQVDMHFVQVDIVVRDSRADETTS